MPKDGERGFALLIVLWSVVLLTLLATGLTTTGRTEVQLAANLRAAAMAEAAADGAIYAAAFHLLDPATPWAADGRPRVVDLDGGHVTLCIGNEAGKVNPNTASAEVLRALLQQTGLAAEPAGQLAAAIVDWRFPGDQGRPGGAKAPQYQAAGLAYGPAGAPFESLPELGAVLGMTPAILARLQPSVSLLNDREPDPQVASPVVLQALRQATGATPSRTGPPVPPRTVTVAAQAEISGSRFNRRAAFRLGDTPKEALVQVLTWDAPLDGGGCQ